MVSNTTRIRQHEVLYCFSHFFSLHSHQYSKPWNISWWYQVTASDPSEQGSSQLAQEPAGAHLNGGTKKRMRSSEETSKDHSLHRNCLLPQYHWGCTCAALPLVAWPSLLPLLKTNVTPFLHRLSIPFRSFKDLNPQRLAFLARTKPVMTRQERAAVQPAQVCSSEALGLPQPSCKTPCKKTNWIKLKWDYVRSGLQGLLILTFPQ